MKLMSNIKQNPIENTIHDYAKAFYKLVDMADMSDENKEKARDIRKSKDKNKKAFKEPQRAKTAPIDNDGEKITTHRVDTMVSVISKLCAVGVDPDIIKNTIIEFNNTKCSPPVTQERLEREVFPAIDRWRDNKAKKDYADKRLIEILKSLSPEFYRWNDRGNGEIFADVFKNYLRWNPTIKSWMYYNGKVWKQDEGGMAADRFGKKLYDALMSYVPTIGDEELRTNFSKHVIALGKRNVRVTMIEDAKDKYHVNPNIFDADDYLLNLQNGVLDLKNFELREHDPNYFFSKICNVSYNPDAKCDRWVEFINEVMQGNQDKINYIQKLLGYSLTGDTNEHACYILYGKTTRNGKSTLVETIGYMLGGSEGYTTSMNPETIAMKAMPDSSKPSNDLARLKGCRFLIAAEPPKKMLLNISVLKRLTGGDTIVARPLYKTEFEFMAKFKLFMNTNFLPLMTDNTIFESDRVNVITFDRHFSRDEQDRDLKRTLRTQEALSGILNWCLEGLKKYYEEGADPPEIVRRAVEEYKEDSDKIGLFIKDCLIFKKGINTPAKDVYSRYTDWCRNEGINPNSKQNFYQELRAKNIFRDRGTVKRKISAGTQESYTCKRVVADYELLKEDADPDKVDDKDDDFIDPREVQVELPFD